MDWTLAIEKNREPLQRIVLMLCAMAGLTDGVPASTLPRRLHRVVLRLLRPAEAAVRRLVVIAARGVVVTPPPPRPRKADAGIPARRAALRRLGIAIVVPAADPSCFAAAKATNAGTARRRTYSLPLIDPLRLPRHRRRHVPSYAVPRISSFNDDTPLHRLPPPPSPHDPLDATRLGLRLAALGRVLDDLPGQALRLARWRARAAARARDGARAGQARRLSPLKPGRAPALPRRFSSSRPAHEVHDILREVHGLARLALETPDTS